MIDGAWQALRDFGTSIDRKEVYFRMKKYSTSYLISKLNLNAREFNELFHRYEEESTEVPRPFPEAERVPEILKDDGGCHFVLTHRLIGSVWGLLKEHRLTHLIEEIVGIDQSFPHKPDPASLNYLVDTFHPKRIDTMMIGDRRLDIEARKNTGVATCLRGIDHSLDEIPTDYVIGNLNEILTLQSIIKE